MSELHTDDEKRQISEWCDALESGEYKQTKGILQDKKGYCCLGVACEMFIPKLDQKRLPNGFLIGTMPCIQPNSPKWLHDIDQHFKDQDEDCYNLYVLNDDFDHTFKEIAKFIREAFL